MQRRSLDQFFLWSAAIFVVVAIAAVVAVQWYSAQEIDRAYRDRAEKVVENGLANYARTLAEKSFPQAYWDDAVVNLDNRFSQDWARQYVGVFFWRTERIDLIATLDRADRTIFAMRAGEVVDPAALAPLRRAAAPLIEQVRRAERERGPLPLLIDLDPAVQQGAGNPPSPLARAVRQAAEQRRSGGRSSGWADRRAELRPISASGIARIDGGIYALAATLVQPDNTVLPLTDRSAIILLGKRLDDDIIREIGADYLLIDAHLMAGETRRARGWSQAELKGADGEVVGVIHWRTRMPGLELVRKTAPALALFALLLATAAWLVMREGRAIARELSASEARASRLAFSDRLTGLPNRAALEIAFETLRAEQERHGEALAVLSIDIDRFKAVNDSYGHPAGDILLRLVAERIRELCEPGHVLGRFGGDEFILMFPVSAAAGAARTAELIVAALSAPFDIGPGRVFVGASVGILTIEAEETIDAPEAFRRADLAMYRAKELGRGQYAFYVRSLDDTVRARGEVQEALRGALEAGGLGVHYQPQVDASGRLIGAEALVRWPEGSGKGIPTAAFVRLAEETGLIDELGSHVMRRVFTDAARWPGLPLAINLSAVQLRAEDFNARIEALAAECGVDPARLEFEITEGVLLDQNEETTAKLERLRALGCRIALDDFGTGFCGLSYLHLYPIDAVKIDMSFTGLLGHEPRAQVLVETIVALAQALGLEVIAEGVETEDQRRLLLEAGCRRFQGYLTGALMPADEFTRRFAGEALTSS